MNKNHTEHFDVIIIGAGPGGLACADILAKSNKSVLLLEKNLKIGPKVCAGGLTPKCMELLNLPETVGGRKFQSVIFQTVEDNALIDYGKCFIQVINREDLGQWQLQKLGGTQIEIRTGVEVTKIENDVIVINGSQRVRFGSLVGADGSNSIVRRFLKLRTKKILVAFQYVVQKNYSDLLCCRDSKLFDAWYAWIFPNGNSTSIGFACFPGVMTMKKAKSNIAEWFEREKIDATQSEFQAHPINCDFQGYHFGNIFLVGDAAGLASQMTGEGIYQALKSGEEVAKIILDNEFRPTGILEIIREKRKHSLALGFLIVLGPFRSFFYYLLSLTMKNKYTAKMILKLIS